MVHLEQDLIGDYVAPTYERQLFKHNTEDLSEEDMDIFEHNEGRYLTM